MLTNQRQKKERKVFIDTDQKHIRQVQIFLKFLELILFYTEGNETAFQTRLNPVLLIVAITTCNV